MSNAAIYARVSSARQKEQETIGSQTAALRAHAEQVAAAELIADEWEGFDGVLVLSWRRCARGTGRQCSQADRRDDGDGHFMMAARMGRPESRRERSVGRQMNGVGTCGARWRGARPLNVLRAGPEADRSVEVELPVLAAVGVGGDCQLAVRIAVLAGASGDGHLDYWQNVLAAEGGLERHLAVGQVGH